MSFEPLVWPTSDLSCLSENCKQLFCSNLSRENNVQPIPIIPREKYSSLTKLLRITSLLFIFFLAKLRKFPWDKVYCKVRAVNYWIRLEQNFYFSEEFSFLLGNSPHIPKLVNNLNLFSHDEILRSKGRLGKCDLISWNLNNPIVLPRESFFTRLMIIDAHVSCKHMGVSSTLNAIRMRGIWISKARIMIKKNIILLHYLLKTKFFPGQVS